MQLPIVAIGIGIGVSAVSSIAQFAGNRWIARDRRRFEERRADYQSAYNAYGEFVEATKGDIGDLHNQRVAALATLSRAADFLDRAKVKDRKWDANFKITPKRFEEITSVTIKFSEIAVKLGVANVGAGAMGAGAAAGAYAAAGAFGTASTGAPISGLSGIAARNAKLAWLGGGSLASGGGGMAAGIASLVSIALAPLAIIPPIVAWTKAVKQSNRIDEAIAKMDVNEAEFGVHMAKLTALRKLSREMFKAVSQVERALKTILRPASPDKLEDIYSVACAAKALADLLDEQFYALLRASVNDGDTARLQAALAGILGVIQENPLGDLEKFRENWADPDFTIEL